MKRIFSVSLTLILLMSFFLNNIWASGQDAEYIRLLNDFNSLETLKQIATTDQNGNFVSVSSGATIAFSEAEGHKNSGAVSITGGQSDNSEITVYGVEKTDFRNTWKDAEYIQFYVNNKSSNELKSLWWSLKPHSSAYAQESYTISPNAKVISSTDGTTWDETVTVDSEGSIVIPAGFAGYVRIPYTAESFKGGEWIASQPLDTSSYQVGGVTVWFRDTNNQIDMVLDDFALISHQFTSDPEGDQATMLFSDYLPAEEPDNPEYIRTLMNFNSAEDMKALNVLDANGSFIGLGSGAQREVVADSGYCGTGGVRVSGTQTDNTQLYAYGAPSGDFRYNWSTADYIQLYVDNNTDSILYLWGLFKPYANAYYQESYQLNPGSTVFLSADGKDFTTEVTVNAEKRIAVPSNFEGFVRIKNESESFDFQEWKPGVAYDPQTYQVGAVELWMRNQDSQIDCILDDFSLVGDVFDDSQDGKANTKPYLDYLAEGAGEQETKDPEVEMPTDVEVIKEITSFTDGTIKNELPNGDNPIAYTENNLQLLSGINYLPAKFSLSDGKLKLEIVDAPGSSEPITEMAFELTGELQDFTGAEYLEFWVKNESDIDIGLGWLNIGGKDISAESVEVSYYDGNVWRRAAYMGDKYNSAKVAAGFEGKMRIKLRGDNSAAIGNTVNNVRMYFVSSARLMGQSLYLDDMTLIGKSGVTPQPDPEVEMPTDVEVIKEITSFTDGTITNELPPGDNPIAYMENGLQIYSGINFLPAKFSLSDGKLKLEIINATAGPEPITEMNFELPMTAQDFTGAEYLEFWVKNESDTDIGLGWLNIGGKDFSAESVEVSYYDGTVWRRAAYMGDKYNSAKVAAGFEGKMRIKLRGENSVAIGNAVNNVRMYFVSSARLLGQSLYLDDMVVYGEKTEEEDLSYDMPTDITNYKTILNFDDKKGNPSIGGINWVPMKFYFSDGYHHDGKESLCVEVIDENGGGEPVTEFRITFPFGNSYRSWKGAEYLEFYAKNPTTAKMGLGWVTIAGKELGKNADVAILDDEGNWKRLRLADDKYSTLFIPPQYEGPVRIKITGENSMGIDVEEPITEIKWFYVSDKIVGNQLFLDSFSLIGTPQEEGEDNVLPDATEKIDVDAVLAQINSVSKKIKIALLQPDTLSKEILEALKKTGKTLEISVVDDTGTTRYQWVFDGSKLTETDIRDVDLTVNVTAQFSGITSPVLVEKPLLKAEILEDRLPTGASLSINTSEIFPPYAKLYQYAEAEGALKSMEKQYVVSEDYMVTFQMKSGGTYYFANQDLFNSEQTEDNSKPGQTEDNSKPGQIEDSSNPGTGNLYLGFLMLTGLAAVLSTILIAVNVMKRRKEKIR